MATKTIQAKKGTDSFSADVDIPDTLTDAIAKWTEAGVMKLLEVGLRYIVQSKLRAGAKAEELNALDVLKLRVRGAATGISKAVKGKKNTMEAIQALLAQLPLEQQRTLVEGLISKQGQGAAQAQ